MKKTYPTLLAALMLALMPTAVAQQVDSAMVTGIVYNQHTGYTMSYCTVQMLQGDDTVATAVTDVLGEFSLGKLPVGVYRLRVQREFSLSKMDLALYGDADLSIAVDTIKLIDLPTVSVVAPRNMLSSSGQLITSPENPRLCYTVAPIGGEPMHREPSNGFKPGRWVDAPFYFDYKKTHNGTYVLLNDIFPDVVKPAAAPAQADTAAAKSK